MPISAFVVGTWQTETQSHDVQGSYKFVARLEFAGSHTLIYNQLGIYPDNSRAIDFYNMKSQYSVLTERNVKIVGRSLEDWIITRDGENLQIDTGVSVVPSGQYRRVTTVQWAIFALGLGILLFGMASMVRLSLARISGHQIGVKMSSLRADARSVASIGLRGLSLVCAFAVGLMVGLSVWGKWPWLLITLPWDAILLLETSLIFLLVGSGISLRTDLKNPASKQIPSSWLSYLGVFLVGLSTKGMIVGIGDLLLYLLLGGSYGAGA